MVCPVLNSSLPLLSRTISVAQQSRPVFHLCARRTFSSVGRKGNWAALSTALVRRSLVDIRSAAAPRPSLTTATATRRPQQHLISTAATARGGTWQAYRQSGLLLGLLAVMSYNAEPVECESVAEHLSDETLDGPQSQALQFRRVALAHLIKSNPADGAAEEFSGNDDCLPPNILDVDKALDRSPLMKTDNAFHETLNSSDTISCPYVLHRPGQEGEGIEAVVRFGKSIAGHPKIVHGGITALTFDNLLGMALFLRGAGAVFTAYLKVDYKAPLPCLTVAVVDITIDRVEGRKLFVTGRLKSLDGKVHYSSAEALFIKPKARPPSGKEELNAE